MQDIDLRLVTAIYEGAFETPLWGSFLEQLRMRTGATFAFLLFRPPHLPVQAWIQLHAGEGDPPDVRRVQLPGLDKQSTLPWHALPANELLTFKSLPGYPGPAYSEFRRMLTDQYNIRSVNAVRLVEPIGAWLAVISDQARFRPGTDALMLSLIPHVARSLRMQNILETERLRTRIAVEAIGKLNFGWLTMDADCRILDIDAHAQAIIARSDDIFRDSNGKIWLEDRTNHAKLVKTIADFASSTSSPPKLFHISRDPWIDMLVKPVEGGFFDKNSAPVAALYLHGEGEQRLASASQVADLFGLRKSEARVAIALSSGLPLSDVAENLGLSIETVRTYSKRIYQKIGLNGQRELMKFWMRSVLALA